MSKTVSDELDGIFKIVNEWLKFAEQKNAALLVLNSGSVWGVSLMLRNQDTLSCGGVTFAAIGFALVFLSSLICVFSFIPILYRPSYSSNLGKRSNFDNCLYFGDIAKYEDADYLALLKHKLGEEAEDTLFERDFASQIITNARITLAKYKKFKLSSTLTVIGFVFFGLTALTIYTGKIF
ncbi:Pycsar system effector family protein [Psychrobacter aquimaris]|uniref:Pycsar system effector family protein n=1 Tax=Psychrobacter aquimaris TaxID=292733 RepID=UPI003FD25258